MGTSAAIRDRPGRFRPGRMLIRAETEAGPPMAEARFGMLSG
jgi:hypothetical protein